MKVRHLAEERLFECYLAEREGALLDPPSAEHLTECGECGSRYAELTQFMEGLSREGAAEADAIFTAERLRSQQLQILRRLEHAGPLARVISFPDRGSRQQLTASAPRGAVRWVAAAAAAGLFVGVAAGWFLDFTGHRTRPAAWTRADQSAVVRSAPAVWVPRAESPDGDMAFLSELERAGDRPRTRELRALDALTPHVREIAATLR
jgi:hypothetical protein